MPSFGRGNRKASASLQITVHPRTSPLSLSLSSSKTQVLITAKRRIPFAAVHLCFSAVVIHLIDARPSNPRRQLVIHHLQICVDALRDLRTAWCAWSDRALRAIQLLAREWYHCDDVSQLQHCNGTTGRLEGRRSTCPDELGLLGTEQRAGASHANDQFDLGLASTLAEQSPISTSGGDRSREHSTAKTDSLAFLFDSAMSDQYTDTLVREWLAESGYDDMLNMAT